MRREKSLRKVREQRLKNSKWYVKVWRVYRGAYDPHPFTDTILDMLKSEVQDEENISSSGHAE